MENKTAALQWEKLEENELKASGNSKIMLELSTTQNVLKNKFKKALANRIESEKNQNQAMEPLIMSTPITKFADSNNNNIASTGIFDNPNQLCDRLRTLFALRFAGNMNYEEEINNIIMKLRKLEILV